jgi:hypothetical protein
LFNSEPTLYMYTCMKHEVAHALTEVVSDCPLWTAGDCPMETGMTYRTSVGVAWNCPMGLARHAPHPPSLEAKPEIFQSHPWIAAVNDARTADQSHFVTAG